MAEVQKTVKDAIKKAYRAKNFIFVFGDMQDAPDNSNIFQYGECRIPKHP